MYWNSLFLIAIILFHLINNFIWLGLDQTYLVDDAYWHFLFSSKVFDLLKQHAFPWLSEIFNYNFAFRWHGILVGYLTAPFYFIFGLNQDSGVMLSSSIFFTILMLSIYGVGKVLFDRRVGLLAAFLLSMYPLVFNHLRIYMLDLPLTSMVVLAIFLLLKSEGFTNKKYSLFFAIVSGLGLLIKFNFALFILGPLILTLYQALKKTGFKQTWRNMAVVIFIIALISFRFYGLKFWEVANRIYGCSWFYAVSFYPGYSPISILQRCLAIGADYLLFFLKDCFNSSVSPGLFILFLFGVFANRRQRGILFTWLALPLLSLAFFFYYPDRSRYFMPTFPALALISSAGIMSLKSTRLRRVFVILVVVFGCIQYFAISYSIDFLPKQIQIKIPSLFSDRSLPITLFKRDLSLRFRSDLDNFSYPVKIQNRNEEILNEILRGSDSLEERVKVFIVGNNVRIYHPLMFEAFVKKLPITIYQLALNEEEKYKEQTLEVDNILKADYVLVVRDRRPNPNAHSFIKKRLEELDLFFEKNITKFALIKEFNFDNGDSLLLYKRRGQNYSKIVKDGLGFYFSDGIVKITFRGREITSAVGLESSFTLEGEKYANLDFKWSSESVSPESLVIYAKTAGLPLPIKWEISIKNNQEIGWKVSMDASLRKKIDNLCLTLFLTARYTQWRSSLGERSFGARNIHAFEEISLPDLVTKAIILSSLKEKGMPKIMFSTDNSSDVVPFVKWRNDLRAVGFYIKTKSESSDKQGVFSGTISFSKGQTDILQE